MSPRLTLTSTRGEFEAVTFGSENPGQPGLIVIEEIWGLNEHIEDVAGRFAREGFLTIAPELIEETVLSKIRELNIEHADQQTRQRLQPKMREAMRPISEPEFAERAVAKLMACADFLQSDERCNGKVGVVGFCFGGTYAFQFALTDPRCDACVVFYGHAPEPLDTVATIACPVLGLYGEKDEGIVSKLPQLEAAMREHDIDFTYTVYPGAHHAFFNDRAPRYDEDAAADAWPRTLAFLRAHLA